MVHVTAYEDRFFDDVKVLWREAFPHLDGWRAPDLAIPAKLATQPELFLIAVDGAHAIGTAIAGYDGHRGWLYSVAVLRAYQRQGVGSALLHEAECRLRALGCRKINLQIVPDNGAVAAFYRRLGYMVEERVCMGKVVDKGAS